MSHASGQPAHGFQFFGLPQTLRGLVVMRSVLCQGQSVVGIAVRPGHKPCCPPHRPAIGADHLGVKLKAVTLPLKQFAKKALAFGALLRVNKIPKTKRGRCRGSATEHLIQRRI